MSREIPSTCNYSLPRVPLHIVTGFLGVGKTTAILSLIDRLREKERIVVIINEWGQIGLDGAIVSSHHPTLEVREINGGCVCCTAGAALQQTIQDILSDINPDRIIIEPSGIAKPGDIIDCLAYPRLAQRIDVRPIIGLVDPVRFLKPHMMDVPIYRDQVEAAEILVANRCDLADQETITAFLRKTATLYPIKKNVHTIRFGILPMEVLAQSETVQTNGALQWSGMMLRPNPSVKIDEKYAQIGWKWPIELVFDYKKLQYFFKSLAANQTDSNLKVDRAKGVFHTDHGWFLMELATGTFHQRKIQYRGQSRCQLITLEKPNGQLGVSGDDINACLTSSCGL